MALDRPNDPLDERVLAFFDGAGPLETPTAGVRVWLANDPPSPETGGLPHPVLIKRLPAGEGKGRATQALALRHPAIVPTRRWLTAGGFLYVVRDVVRGRNLRQSLAGAGSGTGTRPGPELLRRLLLPVLEALQYAHGRGVVHGGLSPENILIAEKDAAIVVCDWATADPKARQHVAIYGGAATVAGDVRALGKIMATYLPSSGAFASLAVRGRIEGVIGRCDTLTDLRDTLESLEKLAAAPVGRAPAGPTPDFMPFPAEDHKPAPWIQNPGSPFASDPPVLKAAPNLEMRWGELAPRVVQGGGGSATLTARNTGNAPLVIRMVATQHAWLNVRPMELPLTVAPGGSAPIAFFLSAARLSPGDYRSEVYLSANAGGPTAEDLRAGWFKHTSELRIVVEDARGGGAGTPGTSATVATEPGNGGGGLAYPADAPRLPPVPGCAGMVVGTILVGLASAAVAIAAYAVK